jgi:hypothetical protein
MVFRRDAEFVELQALMEGRVEDPKRLALGGLLAEPRWQQRAACRNVPTEAFFPLRSECADEAKVVCSGCPVREHCLAYALADQNLVGVWGGTSGRERRDRRWVA